MEKLIYLAFQPEAAAIEDYREHVLGEVSPALLEAGVVALDIGFADLQREIPKPMLLMGDGASLSAAFSLWLESLDARRPIEAALRERAPRVEGFLVTESVPQPCTDRDWPDGARSPGLTHFTWFEKADGISDEEFFHNWHEIHTPFSSDLHPLRWSYVRNAVARTLTPETAPIRAIVGERFREIRDYTDPARLFGSQELLAQSAKEAPAYANMACMHSVPLSEYIVKSRF